LASLRQLVIHVLICKPAEYTNAACAFEQAYSMQCTPT